MTAAAVAVIITLVVVAAVSVGAFFGHRWFNERTQNDLLAEHREAMLGGENVTVPTLGGKLLDSSPPPQTTTDCTLGYEPPIGPSTSLATATRGSFEEQLGVVSSPHSPVLDTDDILQLVTTTLSASPKPKRERTKSRFGEESYLCAECGFGSQAHSCVKCDSLLTADKFPAMRCSHCALGSPSAKDDCVKCDNWCGATKHKAYLCSDCGFGSKSANCVKCGRYAAH